MRESSCGWYKVEKRATEERRGEERRGEERRATGESESEKEREIKRMWANERARTRES